MAGGECRYPGCKKQGVRLAPYGLSWLWVCDEHFEVLNREAEKQERERLDKEEKQLEAKRQASKILYTGPDEIYFTYREYEGRPETYLTLGKRVPRHVYQALVDTKALVKERDPEDNNIYYIIKDEQKAAQILQKYGFKVILSSEWKERLDKAAEILRNAGVDPTYLYMRF